MRTAVSAFLWFRSASSPIRFTSRRRTHNSSGAVAWPVTGAVYLSLVYRSPIAIGVYVQAPRLLAIARSIVSDPFNRKFARRLAFGSELGAVETEGQMTCTLLFMHF